MRPNNEPAPQSQLTPSEKDRTPVEHTFDDNSDRFVHIKNLIALFSQKLMKFLDSTHEPILTSWIMKDEKGPWQVGQLTHTEGTYPPHVIALRDFINFLNAVSENLDTLNQFLKQSRKGIAGIVALNYWEFLTSPGWLSKTHQKYKKIQELRASFEKLQNSIGAVKKLPIKNGIIDGTLYLHDQLSKYLQGDDEGEHLIKVIRVMKDALSSSELFQLKQNEDSTKELLHARLPIQSQLEMYYWKILLATDETQRQNALEGAQKLRLTTDNERAIFSKIDAFAKSPAWDVQRLTFLEHAKPQDNAANSSLTPEKLWLYSLQLKSIISQVMAVSPEFMAEDNDAGNMLRMIGTLKRLPTDMINKIDHEWFMQVMRWLHTNYDALFKDPELKNLTAIVESEYNIHSNFLADLDELETELGLKFGLLTQAILKKIGALKPEWLALSGDSGPTEKHLREQTKNWETYLQQQDLLRAKERIARLAHKRNSLEEKKEAMSSLLEDACLQKMSHIYTLTIEEAQALKNKLIDIAAQIPGLSSLAKYIEKKLQAIETQITREGYRVGRILAANSGFWIGTKEYVTWSNSSANERRAIQAAIEATENELEASIAREEMHLKHVLSDTYLKNLAKKSDLKTKMETLEKEQKELVKAIAATGKKIRENNLEDGRAQTASDSNRAHFEKLEKKYAENQAELTRLSKELNPIEGEENNANARLANSIQQKRLALANIDRIIEENRDMLLEPDSLEAETAMKEQGGIEQFLTLIASVRKPLAHHVADGQLYQEEALSLEKPLFQIRKCDAAWIRELKEFHNLLVQTTEVLSAYQNNLINLFQLINSLSKLFSQAGDILQAINSLEPHIQQNWFKPLQELFSAAQPFALVSSTDENAASPEEPREANSAAANPEALQTQHSLSQKIQKDFKELLVELPSNLPGRAKLDSDLTALFSMINGLLSTTTLASLSAQGLALYNSTEFKALMDLISKISAVAGSDFIYEMVSSYRALLTAQLSAAIQRALTEEIFFGYRPGVLTKGLYQKAEVLAGYGLIDMPTLYTEQLSHLHKQDSDVIIKNHFAAYIESLLKGYATQQKTEWDIMHGNLIKERSEISNEVEKIKRQNTHSRLSTEGKDLDAKQQSFELKKAQINRLIVTKNRAIRFLEDYAAAEHKNRATLASHYAAQEKVWTKLSRIVRQLTMTKWDLYYYEFEKFNTHIRKINDLLGLLETYIDQLATGKPLTTLQASAQNITQKNKDLPPAMQCLFTLALQTIEKDLKYLAPVDAGTNAQLTEQSEPLARHQEVAHPIVEPIQELYKALMDYAHEKAGQLDVKDEWYQRNIIEHLEIFAEMWSEEKTHDPQIIKRRNEILNALQAENAPDYRFLSHPADVKIVYLLTVSGEHGLDLHSRILSKNGMLRANAQFHSQSEGVVRLVEKNEGDTVSVDDIKMAIHSYQRSRKPDAFFNGRGNFLLTDINISYLNDTAKKYALQTNTKGGKKLRAIYNALVNKNYKELLTAVSIKTGFINSDDINKGGFKDQSDETPSPKNNAKPS